MVVQCIFFVAYTCVISHRHLKDRNRDLIYEMGWDGRIPIHTFFFFSFFPFLSIFSIYRRVFNIPHYKDIMTGFWYSNRSTTAWDSQLFPAGWWPNQWLLDLQSNTLNALSWEPAAHPTPPQPPARFNGKPNHSCLQPPEGLYSFTVSFFETFLLTQISTCNTSHGQKPLNVLMFDIVIESTKWKGRNGTLKLSPNERVFKLLILHTHSMRMIGLCLPLPGLLNGAACWVWTGALSIYSHTLPTPPKATPANHEWNVLHLLRLNDWFFKCCFDKLGLIPARPS